MKFKFPDSLVLIFMMIVIAQLASYALPSGEFEREGKAVAMASDVVVELPEGEGIRVEGEEVVLTQGSREIVIPAGSTRSEPGRKVIPGSYHSVQATPLPWHSALTSIPKGMEKSADIIFFVFIVGGVIAVVKASGAIDAVIGAAIQKFGDRPIWLAGGMVTLFALGSSTIGMAEEYMPFIPILVSMCLALKMDAIVAVGIVYIGAGVGYGCAALNPFTVAIAKDIAGQDMTVGMGARWGLLAICIVIGVDHLLRYARAVQSDPSRSLVRDVDYSEGFVMPSDVALTRARIAIICCFVGMIGVFVWGVSAHEWYLVELAGLFLGLALVTAVIARMGVNDVAHAFTRGAAELTSTALLIGFARTIEVVLVDAQVIDTVIHGIAGVLEQAEVFGSFAGVVSAWGMLVVQSICNFLIPSGSGQAFVTMPIMAPLADLTGVGRETAVLAYQFGDGFTNMIVPTNALLMGMLALGRIPFEQWVRFIGPLLAKIYVVAFIALGIAASMQLQ